MSPKKWCLLAGSNYCTVSRNTSNLPIKGDIVANLDPPKNQLFKLQARHGVLVCLAACHAVGRGFYS